MEAFDDLLVLFSAAAAASAGRTRAPPPARSFFSLNADNVSFVFS